MCRWYLEKPKNLLFARTRFPLDRCSSLRQQLDPIRLRAKNVSNFGFDSGLEFIFPKTLVRVWGGTGISGLIDFGSDTTISSLQAGADIHLKRYVFADEKRSLAILGFVLGERMTVNRKVKDVQPNERKFKFVKYDLLFTGAGLSFTW